MYISPYSSSHAFAHSPRIIRKTDTSKLMPEMERVLSAQEGYAQPASAQLDAEALQYVLLIVFLNINGLSLPDKMHK